MIFPFVLAAVGGYLIGDAMEGEMFAKGGVVRIANNKADEYAAKKEPFKGNNLSGELLQNGDYVVLSYGYYPIWYWHSGKGKWYKNKDKFSQTTTKQTSQSAPTSDYESVSKAEIDEMWEESFPER